MQMLKDATGDIHKVNRKHTFHCDDCQRKTLHTGQLLVLTLGELSEWIHTVLLSAEECEAQRLPKYPAQGNKHLYSILTL